MTPLEQRNERLAQTIIKNLKRRHIEGFYCATAEEAVKKVSELMCSTVISLRLRRRNRRCISGLSRQMSIYPAPMPSLRTASS